MTKPSEENISHQRQGVMRLAKAYEVLSDWDASGTPVKSGDIVYSCHGNDYGCSRDDTEVTGRQHIAVILNKHGDYPFFTIPRDILKGASHE